LKITFIFVTHDQKKPVMSDRVAVLSRGRMTDRKAEEIYERPGTRLSPSSW
jgi:ABC-type Fe3+/spermidine/putrescine transport system ATPase subunit